jgi:hypothetical protein
MNAVEIEEALSDLALAPFDAAEFAFMFLAAFGRKDTALKRLRAGNNNASDVSGGVLLTADATRICREDLNEVVTSFLQDKTVLERGLFDQENTLPEELTQLRMGKIVRERYPELDAADQEAVRQHAIAAMNITLQAKLALAQADALGSAAGDGTGESTTQGNTALIDGVRKFVNVRDLDIDLIDRINPFDVAYAVLAKPMDEQSLRQVQASIAAKKLSIPEDETRELAKRALLFKNERGRLPDIHSTDAWEKRMAEGVAALARYRAQAKAARAKTDEGAAQAVPVGHGLAPDWCSHHQPRAVLLPTKIPSLGLRANRGRELVQSKFDHPPFASGLHPNQSLTPERYAWPRCCHNRKTESLRHKLSDPSVMMRSLPSTPFYGREG